MIDGLFTVPIYRSHVGEQQKDEIQKEIDSASGEIVKILNRYCWDNEIDSTFSSIPSVIRHFDFNNLANTILHHARLFLNEFNTPDLNFYLTESWLNYGVPGSFQYEHNHVVVGEASKNRCISGVYYISVPDNSGKIIFNNPWQLAVCNKITEQNSTYSYTPCDGDLIMFPSNLPHKVGINYSDKNRLSISFNIDTESLS